MGKDLKDLKIVNCHLGQGASLCAVKDGKSVETSMGFTPTGGIAMGTRCGDIDPAIIPFLMRREELDANEIERMINKKSGIWGVSGVSDDYRDVEREYAYGDERSILALESQAYIVAKNIMAYTVALQGLDAITFSGGVGERGIEQRLRILKYLKFLGIEVDEEKNNNRGIEIEITKPQSKVKVWVVPTNEELMIARDTYEIVKNMK